MKGTKSKFNLLVTYSCGAGTNVLTITYPPTVSRQERKILQDNILSYMHENKIFPALTGKFSENFCVVPKEKQTDFQLFVESL